MKLSERQKNFGSVMKDDPRMIEGRWLFNQRTKRKHGLRNTPEYNIWRGIKKRCLVPTAHGYKHYGAVGVKICAEWRDSFAAFYRDVGPRPTPLHSIDRWPNAHGNYEPGNVRWATDEEQNRNRPGYNVTLELNGVKRTAAEWAELQGIPATAIYQTYRNGLGTGTRPYAASAPASEKSIMSSGSARLGAR